MPVSPTLAPRASTRAVIVAFLLAGAPLAVEAENRKARAASVEPEPITATDVRFWSLEDVTRIAIQTTGDFEFQTNRLATPPRIYYDLLGCRLQVSDAKMNAITVDDGRLKQIRLAQFKPAVTRVVLDLDADLEATASRLENPHRLMIEIRGGSSKPAGGSAASKPVRVPMAKASSAVEPPPATPEEIVRLGQPAKRNSSGKSSLTRVLGLKIGKVVIDPGHGGHDTGTIGPSGIKEKDISLDVARRVAQIIEERMGSEALLTRSSDTSVPLEARTQLANAERADLFLSIHVNSSRYSAVNGVETFYLNFTRSRADLEVAARENAGSSKSIHELSDLVQKIALDDKIEESRDFASSVQQVVHQLARQQNPKARNRGVKKAPFVVLIGAQMPSVLVEVGFLTNPAEERLLNKPEHRQKIAEALYEGLARYAATLSHFQVAKTSTLD